MADSQELQAAFVYVLCASDEPRFKVGKGNELSARVPAVSKGVVIDFSRSFALKLPCSEKAYRLERIIHKMLEGYRSPRETGDGRTEWFDIERLGLLSDFLAQPSTKLLLGEFEVCPLIKESPAKPIPKRTRPKKQRQYEPLANDAIFASNLAYVDRFNQEIAALDSQGRLIGLCEFKRKEGTVVVSKKISFVEEHTREYCWLLYEAASAPSKNPFERDWIRGNREFKGRYSIFFDERRIGCEAELSRMHFETQGIVAARIEICGIQEAAENGLIGAEELLSAIKSIRRVRPELAEAARVFVEKDWFGPTTPALALSVAQLMNRRL